jgi:hypothetical protein
VGRWRDRFISPFIVGGPTLASGVRGWGFSSIQYCGKVFSLCEQTFNVAPDFRLPMHTLRHSVVVTNVLEKYLKAHPPPTVHTRAKCFRCREF